MQVKPVFESYSEFSMDLNEGVFSNLMKYAHILSHYGDILYKFGDDFLNTTDSEFVEKWSKITGKEIKDLKGLEKLKRDGLDKLDSNLKQLNEAEAFKSTPLRKLKIIAVGLLVLLNVFGLSLKSASASTVETILSKVEKSATTNKDSLNDSQVKISKEDAVKLLKSLKMFSLEKVQQIAEAEDDTLNTENKKLLISTDVTEESKFEAVGKSEDVGGVHKNKGDLSVTKHEGDSKEISKKFQFIENFLEENGTSKTSLEKLKTEFSSRFSNSKVNIKDSSIVYDHLTMDSDDIANGGETDDKGKTYKKGDKISKGVRLVNIKAGTIQESPRKETKTFYVGVKVNRNKLWFEESSNYLSISGTEGHKILALKGIDVLKNNHIVGKDQKQSGKSGVNGYYMINDGYVYFQVTSSDINNSSLEQTIESLDKKIENLNSILRIDLLQLDQESVKLLKKEVK